MRHHSNISRRSRLTTLTSSALRCLLLLVTAATLTACQSAPRNIPAIRAYYQYEFTDAREALRGDAMLKNDEQTILNHARLGLAALADGDLREAERALGHTFDLLSTAGLNEDRTIAAVMTHEGVRIWKGEPFEQALMFHAVATLYAVMGDWENARAAAANSLFRLTDFGQYRTNEQLARRAARDPDFLDEGYTAVDTNFALGFLMQAIAAEHAGTAGRDEQLDAALEIDGNLDLIIERIRAGDYDTLLIVDYGKGPTKIAYGPDNALARFQPQERRRGPIVVQSDGETKARLPAVADINRMAQDHRWTNLEDIRRAKSAIGDALVVGGAVNTGVGGRRDSLETQLIGIGLMAAGLLTKSGAKADTRYLEFLPQSVYVVPLRLNERSRLLVQVEGDAGSRLILPDFEPGTPDDPRAVYLRLHGRDSPNPAWLTADQLQYTNDHAPPPPGAKPWILGGRDVSTPRRRILDAYRDNENLADLTLNQLHRLYEAEDILIGSGMEDRPDRLRNPSFRHVLEGGAGLFTPAPDSMGYKRLMYTPRPPYTPRSDDLGNHVDRSGVTDEE